MEIEKKLNLSNVLKYSQKANIMIVISNLHQIVI